MANIKTTNKDNDNELAFEQLPVNNQLTVLLGVLNVLLDAVEQNRNEIKKANQLLDNIITTSNKMTIRDNRNT